MGTYVIGDLQGCFDRLEALLAHIEFDRETDRLCFAGDLVNRGPASLACLRFVRDLGERATAVLGNHDLHLVAAAYGLRKPSKSDTLAEVLGASDRDELIEWLCHLPLLHEQCGYAIVHAGLPPQWTLTQAREAARELEGVLRDPATREAFLRNMYGDTPRRWRADLAGAERLRYITNAFTRMRYVSADGSLDFDEKRPPGSQARSLMPWFAAPERANRGHPIAFGHWATLQVETPLDPSHGVFHLDTGCVWGGPLSAMRLEDRRLFSVPGWQKA